MNNAELTISFKEAARLSGLPAGFIRKQVENRAIPKSYSIQHDIRKVYVIFRKPFIEWLGEIRGENNG